MTAPMMTGRRGGADPRRLGYRDPGSGCLIVVTTPSAEPKLWQDYLAGAQRSYRAFGVGARPRPRGDPGRAVDVAPVRRARRRREDDRWGPLAGAVHERRPGARGR